MIGDHIEVTRTDGDESYALQEGGRVIARIDRMLMESLIHEAKRGEPIPFLEVNAKPRRQDVRQ